MHEHRPRNYANATMVVLMRDGMQTVLSMQNNYQWPPAGTQHGYRGWLFALGVATFVARSRSGARRGLPLG